MAGQNEEHRQRSLDRLDEQYRTLTAELATMGYILQGSLTKRWMSCGKTACRCTDDPNARHGPYHAWTYKRAGKTVCIYLSGQPAALCAEWIANNRRFERIVRKIRAISRRAAQLREIPAK
jgi:Family of unknown function (DUF6788)